MQQYQLRDYFHDDLVDCFIREMYNTKWNYGIPGGFLTNQPKRQVMAFGNGSAINNEGGLYGESWPTTYWTSKMNQSNVTLETDTVEMPIALRRLVPGLRNLFQKTFVDAKLTDNTFSICVANYYSDPSMNIAAHTDDNIWYPRECENGPVFASITLYPEGSPESEPAYSRFQIKTNNAWKTIPLKHESILIMPSNIEHRVVGHTKKMIPHFRPRINITIRSCYPIMENPLMNAMAVANHTRYYRLPKSIYYPEKMCDIIVGEIWDAYNEMLKVHKTSDLICYTRNPNSKTKAEIRQLYQELSATNKFPIIKFTSNMVIELIEMVINKFS